MASPLPGVSAVEPALVPTPTGPLIIPAAPPGGESVRLSLVLPTFNESKNLPAMVEQLDKLLQPVLGDSYEILLVDDDSPDRTWEVGLALSKQHPRLRVMRRQGERGLSTAVIRGWQAARGEVIGVMDADLQHPPEVNLGLLREIDRGAELAAGSRHAEGGGLSDWSMLRRMLSRGAQLLGLMLLPGVLSRLSDPMSGYFMLRRSAIADVELDPLGYKILIEVVARGRIRWIGEVGYVFRERSEGESKVTWKLYLQYLSHLLKLRWATLPHSHLFRFCVVGATGVVVDMGLLFFLSDPRMLGLGLTRSKAIAAETAIFTNFLLNDFWTFKGLGAPGALPRLRRFLAYNVICSIGLALNILILNALFNYAHVNRYVANAVAIIAVTGWNYVINKTLNWTPMRVEDDSSKPR